MRAFVCLCVACVGIYECMYMYIQVCMSACVCLCAHVWVQVYLCACLCVRVSCVRVSCVGMCVGTISLLVHMGVSPYLFLLISLSLPLYVCIVVHYSVTDSLM